MQTSLFYGGKLPRICFYSDCVADELIKGGQCQKYGGYLYITFFIIEQTYIQENSGHCSVARIDSVLNLDAIMIKFCHISPLQLRWENHIHILIV